MLEIGKIYEQEEREGLFLCHAAYGGSERN